MRRFRLTYIKRMFIRRSLPALEGGDGARKQLARLELELQKVDGSQLVEHCAQRRAVRAQQEELGPEAIRAYKVRRGRNLVFGILERQGEEQSLSAGERGRVQAARHPRPLPSLELPATKRSLGSGSGGASSQPQPCVRWCRGGEEDGPVRQ